MANIVSGDTLDVHFVNRGFGTDEGIKTVQLFELLLNDNQTPQAIICSPFGLQMDKLTAEFENNQWVCDLD